MVVGHRHGDRSTETCLQAQTRSREREAGRELGRTVNSLSCPQWHISTSKTAPTPQTMPPPRDQVGQIPKPMAVIKKNKEVKPLHQPRLVMKLNIRKWVTVSKSGLKFPSRPSRQDLHLFWPCNLVCSSHMALPS